MTKSNPPVLMSAFDASISDHFTISNYRQVAPAWRRSFRRSLSQIHEESMPVIPESEDDDMKPLPFLLQSFEEKIKKAKVFFSSSRKLDFSR